MWHGLLVNVSGDFSCWRYICVLVVILHRWSTDKASVHDVKVGSSRLEVVCVVLTGSGSDLWEGCSWGFTGAEEVLLLYHILIPFSRDLSALRSVETFVLGGLEQLFSIVVGKFLCYAILCYPWSSENWWISFSCLVSILASYRVIDVVVNASCLFLLVSLCFWWARMGLTSFISRSFEIRVLVGGLLLGVVCTHEVCRCRIRKRTGTTSGSFLLGYKVWFFRREKCVVGVHRSGCYRSGGGGGGGRQR